MTRRSKLLRRRAAAAAEAAPVADINTTPLIDVMLVLLVMIIITIPVQLHAVNLHLPVGDPPPAAKPPEVVQVDIAPGGRLAWNGEPLAGRDALRGRLAEAAARPEPPELHVRPDRHARYDDFAFAMAAAHQAGLVKVGVAGGEQYADR
jgi:biopolymer transport protein ExbD